MQLSCFLVAAFGARLTGSMGSSKLLTSLIPFVRYLLRICTLLSCWAVFIVALLFPLRRSYHHPRNRQE